MQDYNEVLSIIASVEKILDAAMTRKIGVNVLEDIQQAIYEINLCLYNVPMTKFQAEHNLEEVQDYFLFIEETKGLCRIWRQSIETRNKGKIDREFWKWYEYFKYVDVEIIYHQTVQRFMELPEEMRINFLALTHRYAFLKDKIDYVQGDFSLIKRYVVMMSEEVEKYKWLYEHLGDVRSKNTLNGIIRYWFKFDIRGLRELEEKVYPPYFDMDILECCETEVVADLGIWDGKSILNFIDMCGSYKKIFAYEANQSVYQSLPQNIVNGSNVILLNKKVGQRPEDAEIGVNLDDEINEPLSLIKMNIGGAEKSAILGAKKHILSDRPKLSVAGYHLPEDIFEIPYLINNIRNDYRFYLRFSGCNVIWPAGIVLYAV